MAMRYDVRLDVSGDTVRLVFRSERAMKWARAHKVPTEWEVTSLGHKALASLLASGLRQCALTVDDPYNHG